MDQNVSQPTSGKVTLHHAPAGIDVTFVLEPGSHARIGAAAEMEISLPLAGLEPYELRLDRDPGGHLIARDGRNTYVVADGSEIRIGPYGFTVRDFFRAVTPPPPPEEVPAPRWSVGPEKESEEHGVGAKRPGKPAVWIAAGLVALGAVVFAVRDHFPAFPRRALTPPPGDPARVNSREAPEKESAPRVAAKREPMPVEAAVKPEPRTERATPPADGGSEADQAGVAADAKEAVYTLTALDNNGRRTASGVAFAIWPSGYLVTNAHVVEKGTAFQAVTEQGETLPIKTVRAYDRTLDLAVLEVGDRKKLKGLKIADEGAGRGQTVAVYYGNFQKTTDLRSEGILSAIGPVGEPIPELMQVTAPVPEGRTGSPVLNTRGEVVGVITLRWPANPVDHFAIPSRHVSALLRRPAPPEGLHESFNRNAGPMVKAGEPPAPKPIPDANGPMLRDALYGQLVFAKSAFEWVEALKLAERLAEKYPDAPDAHLEAGTAAQLALKYEAAERAYQAYLALEPFNAVAWNNLGLVYFNMGRTGDAESAYERSAEVDPTHGGALRNLISARIIQSKWMGVREPLMKLGEADRAEAEKFVTDLFAKQGAQMPPEVRWVVDAYRSKFPETESPPSATENALELARGAVEAFLKSRSGKDARAEARSYAATVSPYFAEKFAMPAGILSAITEDRRKWPVRRYRLQEIENVSRTPGVSGFSVRFVFTYEMRNGSKLRQGTARQEALFSEGENHTWVVKGIVTLKETEEPN